MLYKEYEPEVLKKLQAVETEILADFNTLCEENGIDYFAVGGTLIGTVRHKGFIPWDDDIDLGMTRKNYDKFLQIGDNAFNGKYRTINYEIDNKFAGMFTKWYKAGTVFRDKDAMVTGCVAGIPLDIFCFENVPEDEPKRRKQGRWAWIWGKIFILRNISRPTIYAEGLKVKIVTGISMICNGALRLFRISPSSLYEKAQRVAKKYNNIETSYVSYLFDPTPHLSVMKREDLEPTKWAEFENIKIRIPNKAEKYLELRFGDDYMIIPPEDKRHNHPPMELDFGSEE